MSHINDLKMYLRSAVFYKRFQYTFHGAVIWKIKKVKNTKNQLNTVHADAILLWLLLHADKYFFTHLHSEWEH